VWIAPPGKSLAISVLLRPSTPAGAPLELEHFGWLPLIAGVAMREAVASVIPSERVGLKWPNDVQVDGLKVSGLLAELAGDAVVMGAGVNLTMTKDELPTDSSTSLLLEGASEDGLADTVLSTYLTTLRTLYTDLLAGKTRAIRDTVVASCTTIGKQVRVELPGGGTLFGVATGIDESGRLQVSSTSDGRLTAVAAGDVTHLRYE
jgi:BirA family biotin operon repressor/biotin-[acetyl-CoA-carboxylase] ligase